MKEWTILTNAYWKTAHYLLTEAPWYIYFLESANFTICDILHKIPILNWGRDFPLCDRWHIYIGNPIFQWCEKQKREWWIDIDYQTIKDKHPGKNLNKKKGNFKKSQVKID